jgi:hypothetical protein
LARVAPSLPAADAKKPAGHREQRVASGAANEPPEHIAHAVAPEVLATLPKAQGTHAVFESLCPAKAPKVPGLHAIQLHA